MESFSRNPSNSSMIHEQRTWGERGDLVSSVGSIRRPFSVALVAVGIVSRLQANRIGAEDRSSRLDNIGYFLLDEERKTEGPLDFDDPLRWCSWQR